MVQSYEPGFRELSIEDLEAIMGDTDPNSPAYQKAFDILQLRYLERQTPATSGLGTIGILHVWRQALKNFYQTLKVWYRGPYRPYSTEEIIAHFTPRYGEPLPHPLPERFAPPLLARMVNSVTSFLIRAWKWAVGTLLVLIGVLFTYLRPGK